MKTRLLALLLATTLAAPLAHAATPVAEPGYPLLDFVGERLTERLDLAPDQLTELKAILHAHQPLIAPLADTVRDEHQAWLDFSRAHPDDTAGLDAQADRMLAAQKQLMLATVALRADLRQTLTPDQLARLDSLRAESGVRLGQFRARLQAWLARS